MATSYFSWEEGLSKNWDALLGTEDGQTEHGQTMPSYWSNTFRTALQGQMKRGMIRHTCIVLDASSYSSNFEHMLSICRQFCIDFFDENPISQLGFLYCRDGLAYVLSDMSSNSESHLSRLSMTHLNAMEREATLTPGTASGTPGTETQTTTSSVLFECKGVPSLQNSLVLAKHQLQALSSTGLQGPSRAAKEIIVLYAGLISVDPYDIHGTIQELKKDFIRTSIICTSGEVSICKKLCQETQGMLHID